jgi:hypothetical protein
MCTRTNKVFVELKRFKTMKLTSTGAEYVGSGSRGFKSKGANFFAHKIHGTSLAVDNVEST